MFGSAFPAAQLPTKSTTNQEYMTFLSTPNLQYAIIMNGDFNIEGTTNTIHQLEFGDSSYHKKYSRSSTSPVNKGLVFHYGTNNFIHMYRYGSTTKLATYDWSLNPFSNGLE